ncbi:MAG TPA: hypothetical protein VE379_04760 [Vicinamibacterales bacterium]|nr:hypothetical protein [Vicinamibacterales bacterium]
MTRALRVLATVIAVAAIADPSFSRQWEMPPAVAFRVGPSTAAAAALETLQHTLGSSIATASASLADALVVVDGEVDPSDLRDGVTVSFLSVARPPNVRLVSARARGRLIPRQEALLEVIAEQTGLAGRTTQLTVTNEGAEVGRIDHTWTALPTEHIRVPVLTLVAGAGRFTVTAELMPDETHADDNSVEANAEIEDTLLRVAFFEPRPSWAAGFVRRAIERDAAFDVASVVRPSRGIDVSTPRAPLRLTPSSLASYDVVAVGAPEELRPAEVEALRQFAADRGGTVVFLPDRRPAGAYAALVGERFEEVLLSAPSVLHVSSARGPRASELVIPPAGRRLAETLAALSDGRSVIAARPLGDGTVVFSGALDAWRYRADDAEPFAAFWRGALARAALNAAPRVNVALQPAVVGTSRPVGVRVRLRGSELEDQTEGTLSLPSTSVAAVAVGHGSDGERVPIRVWPTGETGVLEGRFVPPRDGDYVVVATTASGANGRATLRRSNRGGNTVSREEAAAIAAATGGVAADDPERIVSHLRGLPGRRTPATLHPMRSAWWALPFSLALCAEWSLRRRAGRR